VVSVLDQRSRGRNFESSAGRRPVALCTLGLGLILSSIPRGRKMSTSYGWEGLRQVCPTLLDARKITWAPLRWHCLLRGAITNVLLFHRMLGIILHGESKNMPPNCCPYLRKTLTDFKHSFTDALYGKFGIKWLLNIPQHLSCVATSVSSRHLLGGNFPLPRKWKSPPRRRCRENVFNINK